MRTRPRRLGIRARVVASFVTLLAIAVLVSIGVLQQVGSRRIDAQVTQDLSTAAADLRARLGQDASTLGRPGGPTLTSVFDDYLRARPARGDQAFLAIVDGRPFATSAGSRVALQTLPIASRWAAMRTSETGQVATDAGALRWLAVPVLSNGRLLGVLVATELLAGQQHALRTTMVTESLVMLLVLAAASLLAWGAAGRALAPVRGLAEAARSERPDQHPVPGVVDGDEVGEEGHGGVGLEVDVEPGRRERREQLGQRRHRLTATDQDAADLGVRHLGQPALRPRDPVERVVVEGQQDAVTGGVHVGLQVAVAEPDRVLEGGEGVLEAGDVRVGGSAAMGSGQQC